MTELVQRKSDGKWCFWAKLDEKNQPEEYSSEWVLVRVYDFLIDVEYV